MRLDIVIPAHNEEHRIGRMLDGYTSRLRDPEVRFIVALDACTDATEDVVRAQMARDSRVRVMPLSKLGKGGVIREAFARSDAELVGFVDADGATPPDELMRLADATRDADGAIASRRHPAAVLPAARSVPRRLTSAGFALGVRTLLRLPYADTQCGAKVLRRDSVQRLLPALSADDLSFDVDLLLAAREHGQRIVELPTVWIDRQGSRVSAVHDARRMGGSVLKLWASRRRPDRSRRRPDRSRRRPDRSHRRRVGARPNRAADVTLITPYPRVGVRHGGMSGVASYSANLAHALSDAGARVDVVAPLEPGEAPRREQDGPVAVRRAFPRQAAGARAATREALRTGSPVVHLQHEFFLYGGPASTPGFVAGLRAMRARDRRALTTLHQVIDPATVDRDFTELHRVRIPAWAARRGLSTMQRLLHDSADRVLVHEPEFAGVLPGAEVVPHGIEPVTTTEGREAARRELGLAPGRLVVLCFGFLAPYKGLEAVLEAAAIAGPEIETIVAGGEHPRLVASGDAYHRALRERYGAHARFTGRVEDDQVGRWFTAADLAVFMYPRPFSSSGALALAVAHRTPMLVSPELARTAGLPEQLICDRAPEAIAARMRSVAADRDQLRQMRAQVATVGEARSWPVVAERHLELYKEVSGGRRLARG